MNYYTDDGSYVDTTSYNYGDREYDGDLDLRDFDDYEYMQEVYADAFLMEDLYEYSK